jgi:hypothetical protein
MASLVPRLRYLRALLVAGVVAVVAAVTVLAGAGIKSMRNEPETAAVRPVAAAEPTADGEVKAFRGNRPARQSPNAPRTLGAPFEYDVTFPVSQVLATSQQRGPGTAPVRGPGVVAKAMAELRRCFNCSFPVEGAPAAYPSSDQFIPLKVCVGPACRDAPVQFYPHVDGFGLVAQPGHFEGDGSTIRFRLLRTPEDRLHLNVHANNTNPTEDPAVITAFARNTWHSFANRLGTNIAKFQGCGGLGQPC